MDGARTYPNNLRVLRTRAGLTQEQTAERFGCSVQCYQNYEYGKREMRASTLKLAARVFGCTVAEVMGLEPAESAQRDHSKGASVPVVSVVGDDDPRLAANRTDERWYVPLTVYSGHVGSFYCRIDDNAMDLLIPKGALVLIDPGSKVATGDVAMVRVKGQGTSISRVYWAGDTVVFHPESTDPERRDYSFDRTSKDAPDFDVVGRVVSYTAPKDWRP